MASRQGRTRSSSNWSMPTTNRLIKRWYGSPFLSGGNDMSTATPTSSTITARTQFLTAPRGGEDIMHLEKPTLAKPLSDSTLRGYAVLQKIFFAPTESSQAAGQAFI